MLGTNGMGLTLKNEKKYRVKQNAYSYSSATTYVVNDYHCTVKMTYEIRVVCT